MRPVVGCFWFFCFFLASTPAVKSETEAASANRTAAARSVRGARKVPLACIGLDLLRPGTEDFIFEAAAVAAAARAGSDREQPRPEEQERDRLGNLRRRGRRVRAGRVVGRRLVALAGADAAHADERDA